MKRVLVAHFSQTGQLRRIAESMCAPLADSPDVELQWLALEPVKPYPFPWPFFDFFDQFPESVHLRPPPMQAPDIDPATRFDLIVLAYPVWFLAPAPPTTAFLQSELGRALLRDTPVVTVIGCRNMWLSADREARKLLAAAGARHCDHVVLTDRGSSLATFISTPRWMLTGRTDSLWGLLPPPGVTAADIAACRRFGEALLAALRSGELDGHRPVLTGLAAVTVDDRLIAAERIGRRSFEIWGRLVMAAGAAGSTPRRAVLVVYAVFLVAMIVTVVPVTMILRALLRPFISDRLTRLKHQYEQPSGSGSERVTERTIKGNVRG